LDSKRSQDNQQALLDIVPIGPVDSTLLAVVAANLETTIGLNVDIRGAEPQPEHAFLPGRGQYDADKIITHLDAMTTGARYRLGITQYDICTAILTFVFGESQLGGRTALISVYRIKDTLPERTYLRSAKIGCHEVGHLMGIGHCRAPDCLMRFSSNLEALDRLPLGLCSACTYDLARRLKSLIQK
jgi:archaemetzincin